MPSLFLFFTSHYTFLDMNITSFWIIYKVWRHIGQRISRIRTNIHKSNGSNSFIKIHFQSEIACRNKRISISNSHLNRNCAIFACFSHIIYCYLEHHASHCGIHSYSFRKCILTQFLTHLKKRKTIIEKFQNTESKAELFKKARFATSSLFQEKKKKKRHKCCIVIYLFMCIW